MMMMMMMQMMRLSILSSLHPAIFAYHLLILCEMIWDEMIWSMECCYLPLFLLFFISLLSCPPFFQFFHRHLSFFHPLYRSYSLTHSNTLLLSLSYFFRAWYVRCVRYVSWPDHHHTEHFRNLWGCLCPHLRYHTCRDSSRHLLLWEYGRTTQSSQRESARADRKRHWRHGHDNHNLADGQLDF